MKIKLTAFVFFIAVLGALLSIAGNARQADDPGVLLRAAIEKEEVDGDLQGAITLYEQILKQFPESREIAGKAQLHIGLCYEKLGKTEAIKAYELVLEKYSGQKELVAVARARLAVLKKEEPEGLTVTKMEFHVPDPFGISPDGTKILGVRFGKGQNIVVSHIGKDKVDFITDFESGTDEYYWTYNPVWSPDGKEIAYLASYSGKEGKNDYNLRVSTLDGQTRILISSETDWFIPNAWMPDGSSILTIKGDEDKNQELGLVPSEGGEFKKLISLQGQVERYGQSRASACVSPDGRFIVYTDKAPGEESEIFITNSNGKMSWPLVKHPAAEGVPRWSPDGKHIIFLSNRHRNWDLWGVAVEEGKAAGHPFLIREGMANNKFGNWTVHGLVSWNWVRMMDIFTIDVNPATGEPVGKPKQLDYTPTGGNLYPVCAPEGNRLAFIRMDSDDGKWYVVVTHSDGGGEKEYVLAKGYWPWVLSWMPDGRGIGMYCKNMNGENILLSLRFDTEEWETIPIPVAKGEMTPFEWSGSSRAFMYGKNGLVEEGAGIIEHNLETGEERYVYRPKEGSRVNFRMLKCAKDYKKLAFLETNTGIMVVDLETGESHLAAPDFFGFPSWSPDGQRIMSFGALNPDKERLSLVIFPASGGSAEEYDLSKDFPIDSRIVYPDWSADGTQVVFMLNFNKSEHLIYKNIIPKEK